MARQQLSRKLDKALDAAIDDPAAWVALCDALATEFKGVGTSLLPWDNTKRYPHVMTSQSLVAGAEEYVRGGWYRSDFREKGYRFLSAKGWTTDTDFISPEETKTTSYYCDFLKKFGIGGFIGILFHAGDQRWVACVQFPVSKIEPTEREIEMVPEIAERLTIAAKAVLSETGRKWDVLFESGDIMDRAVLALDWDGTLCHGNRLAHELFSDQPASSHNNRASKINVAGLLGLDMEELAERSKPGRPPSRYSSLDEKRFIWKNTNGDEYAASASVVLPHMRMFASSRPVIVILKGRRKIKEVAYSVFSEEFGLTETERKIAYNLMMGHSVKKVAKTLSITEGNARQHIKKIFRKMDVDSQHQLVTTAFTAITDE